MFAFFRRPKGYIVGLLLLLVSLIVYIAGFSSPHWIKYHVSLSLGDGSYEHPFFTEEFQGYGGLWKTCAIVVGFMIETCFIYSSDHHVPGWLTASQAFHCLGLIGFILACGYAIMVNFVQSSPALDNRHLEILLMISGVVGFIGCIVYAAKSGGHDILPPDERDLMLMPGESVHVEQDVLGWAFCFSLTASLLSLGSAVLICANNRLEPQQELPSLAVSFSRDQSQV